MDYKFGKYNLHTHSFYCGHGSGQLKDYVREVKAHNFELLGFSEHCPVKEDRWNKSRMDYKVLDSYLDDINSLKRIEEDLLDSNKVDNDRVEIDNLFSLKQEEQKPLKILSGFECDYFKEYHNYYQELLEKCDYLIFGVHYLNLPTFKDFPLHNYPLDKKALSIYADQYIKSIESNLFSIAAHPDLFFIQYFKWDEQAKAISKEIIEAALYYDVALEVNGNGITKGKIKGFNGEMRNQYPVKEFWDLAKSYDNLKIIANADAHSPYNIEKPLIECKKFADDLSFEYYSANIDTLEKTHKIEFIK
jgi:histidinol-phosphatase (PHP family)